MPKKIVLSEEKLGLLIKSYQEGISLAKLEKIIGNSRGVLSKILKENNIKIRTTSETSRKYSHDYDYFNVIDSEEKAYWLGFLYADGFIESKRQYGEQKFGITLSSKDENHLYKFKKAINASNPVLTYIGSGYAKENSFCKILLTGQQTVNDLISHGVLENKTFKLDFPYGIRRDLYKHFIRGYFDGDGYITISEDSFLFGFSGTELLLTGIKNFFSQSKANILKDKNIYSFKIGGTKKAFSFLNEIYSDSTIYLDRKYEKYKIVYNKYSEN